MQRGDTPPKTVVTPDPVKIPIVIPPHTMSLTVTAEHWQFFAFVFAALVTLALVLIDEIPGPWPRWFPRWEAKILVFIAFGYLTLYSWPVKNLLVRMLPTIKTKIISTTISASIMPRSR